MISIIITTFKEGPTLSKSLERILNQKSFNFDYEVLVVAPDQESREIVEKFAKHYPQVRYIQDKAKGKPAALNLAIPKAEGDIIVSTDGDVLMGRNALPELLSFFQDPKVGATSGRPVSTNSRKTLWGYWSHFLTNAAHKKREKKNIWPCSGYLYAFRKIKTKIPSETFSEDALITEIVRQQGYLIKYAPQAKVYVKYPNNFQDWLRQKVRSTGGYLQKAKISQKQIGMKKMRNFGQEVGEGFKLFFTYPQNFREYFWTFLLYLARIYLWLLVFWKIVLRKTKFNLIWQRVESTK